MTMKNKTFDCVEMKNQIQAERAEKYKGLTGQAYLDRLNQNLMESETLTAKWWRGEVGDMQPAAPPIDVPLKTPKKNTFDCVEMKNQIRSRRASEPSS